MTTSHGAALNERCREIIETALASLKCMGMADAEAARLLLIQGTIRLGDDEALAVMLGVLGGLDDEAGGDPSD